MSQLMVYVVLTTKLSFCLWRFVFVFEQTSLTFFQEDMNLNEDKKTPLREKDLNTKREMVLQYVFAASKAVSFLAYKFTTKCMFFI